MTTFGLDIGSTSVKAVQLERQGSQFSLVAAGIIPTPAGGLEQEGESQIEKVAQKVKVLLNQTKISAKDVAISLPESKVFSRLVKLPYLTDKEIDAAVSWQAEPYIPIPVSDASIDYQVVRRTQAQGNSPGSVEVLLVATPKALVGKYLALAELLGLTVVSAESDLLSLSRAVVAGGTQVLVDLGASSTNIGVFWQGQLVVSHSVATGGSVFTRALSQGLNVTPEQAEEYKKAYGLSPQLEGKVKQVLEPVLQVVIDEVKKAIHYFQTEFSSQETVSSLILSGGGAGLAGIVPYFTEKLGVETAVGDAFAKIVKDGRLKGNFSSFSPLYGVAVGLAMA